MVEWWEKERGMEIRVPSAKYVQEWLRDHNHLCSRDWPREEGEKSYEACHCEQVPDRELARVNYLMRGEDETVDKAVALFKSPEFETYYLRGIRIRVCHIAGSEDDRRIEVVADTFANACAQAKDMFDKYASRRTRRKRGKARIWKIWVCGLLNNFERECRFAYDLPYDLYVDNHWGDSGHLDRGGEECFHVAAGMAYDHFLLRLERQQRFKVRDVLHKLFIWRRARAMRKLEGCRQCVTDSKK